MTTTTLPSPTSVVALTCLCGELGARHRLVVHDGEPVRTSCKDCPCEQFEAAPPEQAAAPTEPVAASPAPEPQITSPEPATPEPAAAAAGPAIEPAPPAAAPPTSPARPTGRRRNGRAAPAGSRTPNAGPGRQRRPALAPTAGTVYATYDAFQCFGCGSRYSADEAGHACGPLVPVTVTITVRST